MKRERGQREKGIIQRKGRESRKEGRVGGVERDCPQRRECDMKGKRLEAEIRERDHLRV